MARVQYRLLRQLIFLQVIAYGKINKSEEKHSTIAAINVIQLTIFVFYIF